MALNSLCKRAREMRPDNPGCCKFFKNLEDGITPNGTDWNQDDIEDLHLLGEKHKICPYYLQKNRAQYSDLILMPYNYLVDSKIRDNYKIDFANSIIIIDEAHNIERVAEDVASFDLNMNSFYSIFAELSNLIKHIEAKPQDMGSSSLLNHVLEIQCLTKNFVHYMYNIDINRIPGRMNIKEVNDEDAVFEGSKIFEFFFEGTRFKNYKDYSGPKDFEGLKPSNFGHWIYIFDKCIAELTEKT